MGRQGRFFDELVALAVIVVATVLGTSSPPVQAGGNPIVYAALGDSFAAGVGSATLPYDLDLPCARTQGAYPVLWANSRSVTQFTFAACSGAKTTDVIASQLGALSAATTLVTVTAGGDDANGVQTLLACSPVIPILQTTESAGCVSAIATFNAYVQTELPGLLTNMYRAIQQAAPNATIIAIGYNGSFEPAGSDQACTTLLETAEVIPVQQARVDLDASGQLLRNVIQAAAQASGVIYIDPVAYFNGHRICTSSPPPWINTVVPGGLTAYHPTTTGYASGYFPALSAQTTQLGF
jgi:lysophospholipase L1-like esterase